MSNLKKEKNQDSDNSESSSNTVVEQNNKISQQNDQLKESQDQIKALIEALKNPNGPDAGAIRAEKVQKITLNLCKSSKLKPFNISQDVKLFQKLFIEQLTIMKAAVGITDDLT